MEADAEGEQGREVAENYEANVKTLVKVCGMTRPDQVEALDALGVDLLGFIFAAKSPRRVRPEQVAAVARGRARRVGVFVEHNLDETRAVMNQAKLDLAQLHGCQNPDFCRALGADRVVKVFWPSRHADTASLLAEMRRYADACAFMLLDAGTSGGGHGVSLDFAALAGLASPRPWFLAGGLSPQNLAQALRLAKPDGVDLNSGVESSPGVKNIDTVRHVLQLVESTDTF